MNDCGTAGAGHVEKAGQPGIGVAALPDRLVAEEDIAIEESLIISSADAEHVGLVGELGGQQREGHVRRRPALGGDEAKLPIEGGEDVIQARGLT